VNTSTRFRFQTVDTVMNAVMVGAMAITCVLLLAN